MQALEKILEEIKEAALQEDAPITGFYRGQRSMVLSAMPRPQYLFLYYIYNRREKI